MNQLNHIYCRFSDAAGYWHRFFWLKPDGNIVDINSKGHDNERFWALDGNQLVLLNQSKEETSRFDCKKSGEKESLWEGLHRGSIPLKITAYQDRSDLWNYKTKYLCQHLIEQGVLEVGDHTYGKPELIDSDYGGKVVIGDYTSIGPNVRFIAANHCLDLVTTYPFKTLSSYYTENPLLIEKDHEIKQETRIGNDVWIGNNVQIMAGLTIGDGAVLAAGAVITKHVPPYAIVGGNPAHVIRYRIREIQLRQAMLKIAWWKWPEQQIADNLDKIMSQDISGFVQEFLAKSKED